MAEDYKLKKEAKEMKHKINNKKSQVRMTGLIIILALVSLTVIALTETNPESQQQVQGLQGVYTINTNNLSIPLPKDLEGYKGYSLRVQGRGEGELKDGVIYFTNVQENLEITLTLFYKDKNKTYEFSMIKGNSESSSTPPQSYEADIVSTTLDEASSSLSSDEQVSSESTPTSKDIQADESSKIESNLDTVDKSAEKPDKVGFRAVDDKNNQDITGFSVDENINKGESV